MRMIDADALREIIEDHVTAVSCCPTVDWSMGKTQFKKQCLDDIDNAPTVMEWTNVNDKLPEVDMTVLVYAVPKKKYEAIHRPKMVITRMSNVNFLNCKMTTDPYWISPWQYFFENYEITHWMIPKPPKDGEE